jgi:hypothetical protein
MEYKDCVIEDKKLVKVDVSVTEFVIPNFITSIGDYVFNHCEKLKSINIPNTVTEIGLGAFCNCKTLTFANIPNTVTVIRGGTFYNCNSLISISIPNSVTHIGTRVFTYTPFENIFNKLKTIEFIKFVNSKDKIKYVKNNLLQLDDIKFLLDKEEYNGYINGVNYGI